MQKFADLKALGTKLQIISAFAVDHSKGFVYIEAERQCDINEVASILGNLISLLISVICEMCLPLAKAFIVVTNIQFQACKGITGIYVTRVHPVPRNEVFHLFSVQNRNVEISEGMWARIKSGNYKGDLAQVLAQTSNVLELWFAI